MEETNNDYAERLRQKSRSFEVKHQLPMDKRSHYLNEKTILSLKQTEIISKDAKKYSKLSELKYTSTISDSIKYHVSWINHYENSRVYDVILELPSQCTVEDCIIQTTKYINHKLKDLQYQIPEKAQYYEVFHAKKNGFPKDDYPCLEYGQLLAQIKISNLCIVEKKDFRDNSQKPDASQTNAKRGSSFCLAQKTYQRRSETTELPKKPLIVDVEEEESYSCLCLRIFRKKATKGKLPKDNSK